MPLSSYRISLRVRIFATIGLVLLPIGLGAAWLVVAIDRHLQTLDHLIAQSAQRLETTVNLQSRILETASAAVPATGNARQQRVALLQETRAIDGVFRDMLQGTGLRPRDRALVERAHREWRQESARGSSAGDPPVATGQAARLLGTLADIYRHESEGLREQLEQRQRGLWGTALLAAAGGLLIAAVAGSLLTRSVLRPLREFRAAISRYADHDLAYRLPGRSNGEFGQLASEINRMAARLETRRNELQDQSARDPLTGLFNRREFNQRLETERERGRRYGKACSLLMIDVDHFKAINDRHGHPAGDEVLTTIADLLRLRVRPMDVVCRYGGEEFAVLLPETDSAGATALAERIRRAVADSAILVNEEIPLRATVSIGVASFSGPWREDIDPVSMADEALYRAKHEGRNRVATAAAIFAVRPNGAGVTGRPA
jgi:diguanylate cyclase (GGDEF)-like protein